MMVLQLLIAWVYVIRGIVRTTGVKHIILAHSTHHTKMEMVVLVVPTQQIFVMGFVTLGIVPTMDVSLNQEQEVHLLQS